DLPAKAPRTAQEYISDWSGFYVGVGACYGWGHDKFDNPRTTIDNLFNTSVASVFDKSVLVQPNFTIPVDLSQSFKERGFVAGGFFGAQKQFGNWVLGLEADVYATGIKGSFSGSSTRKEDIKRFVPTTTFTVPGQDAAVSGSAFVKDTPITIKGQEVISTGNVVITPQGLVLTQTISGLQAGETIKAGTSIPVILTNQDQLRTIVTAVLTQDVTANADGKAIVMTGVGGNLAVADTTIKVFTTDIKTTGGTVPVTVTGKTLDQTVVVPGQIAPVSGKAAVLPVQVTIGLPKETTVTARVDRSLSLSTSIEELGSVRGKIGLAASPNWMIYGTGGLGWAHVARTM